MHIRNNWPLLIMIVIASFLTMTAWSFHRAASGASAITDPDYYNHGLRYDQTMLEQKTAAGLGWKTATELQGRLVTIELRDHGQRAVTGAVGSLTLFGPGKLRLREVGLRETRPGIYLAELPIEMHGEHPAEISFQRDGAKLRQRLLFSVK